MTPLVEAAGVGKATVDEEASALLLAKAAEVADTAARTVFVMFGGSGLGDICGGLATVTACGG